MILRLRMLSDELENFSRVYEVPAEMTLLDFHKFICDDLEYDPKNFCSFFMSNEKWDKLQEYTLVDMEDDDIAMPMEGILLSDVAAAKKDRLIFMFDIFAARTLFIEVREVLEPDPDVYYPIVVSADGDTPPQLETDSLITEDSPFNDAMEDFMYFEGSDDDTYSDDL